MNGVNDIMETTIKDAVREKYAEAARQVTTQSKASCCGSRKKADPITTDLYGATQTQELPQEAVLASLGCGNPTLLAQLNPGETVLDLGSGGGIDVLLSARRVGPTRFADSSTSMPPPDPRSSTV